MSPRAACQLERLGFVEVYDYVGGKADWRAAGRPTDKRDQGPLRVIAAMDRDVPTCGPDDRVAAVVQRLRDHERATCVVVNERRVVLGRLRSTFTAETAEVAVGQVMEPGPTTVRADASLEATRQRLAARGVEEILVTTPDGELLGAVYRGP